MPIRPARADDFGAIVALNPADFATPRRMALLRARLADADAWVGEHGAACVGYAWRGQFFGHDFLELLYVEESHRRAGVASALIEAFEQARRTPKLFVSTNRSNAPMRTLLARRGYAPSGVVHDLDAGDPELFFVRRYDGEVAEAFSAFHTDRLSLRPAAPGDRDDLIALERDPEVMRFINGGRPTPDDGIDSAVGFRMPRGGEPGVWTAVESATQAFVGWFSLRPRDGEVAELGYRLRREAWGRGFGSEGARALVREGFAEMYVDRIVATAMAVNHASRRVMEKAGLTYGRTVHVDWEDPLPGSELGDVEYALTRDAWQGGG